MHTLNKMPADALVAWDRDIAPLIKDPPTARWLVDSTDSSVCVSFEGWPRSPTLWVAVQWRRDTGVWAPTFPLPFASASRERQLEALFNGTFEQLAEDVGCRSLAMRRGDPGWDDLGVNVTATLDGSR